MRISIFEDGSNCIKARAIDAFYRLFGTGSRGNRRWRGTQIRGEDGVMRTQVISPRSTTPGPNGRSAALMLASMVRDPLVVYLSLAARYGDAVRVPISPRTNLFMFSRPEHAEHVLAQNQDNYVKAFTYRPLRALIGNGLLTSEGEDWRRHRRLIQPLFTRRDVGAFGPVMTEAAGRMLKEWDDRPEGSQIDVALQMSSLALDIVGRTLFGSDLTGDAAAINRAMSAGQRVAVLATFVPLPWGPRSTKALKAVARRAGNTPEGVEGPVGRMIADRRALLAASGSASVPSNGAQADGARASGAGAGGAGAGGAGAGGGRADGAGAGGGRADGAGVDRARADGGQSSGRMDLLGTLLTARREDGSPFTDTEIGDELATFMLAGHETSAVTLAWSLALLSAYPAARDQLEHEVDTVLGGREPEAADIDRLPWTTAVIAETLRLYPPAWTIERDSIADDNVAGVRVPAGSTVAVPPYLIHRHPEFWPDPAGFDPARFVPSGAPGTTAGGSRVIAGERPRYAYIPFGGGRRACVGQSFAELETVLVLASIAQRFRLDLTPLGIPKAFAGVTLRPGRLPMRLLHR
jgi:cytochrome P450